MSNPFSLENKTIIITGATGGIGKSCANECAKMGAKVILIGRNIQKLQEIEKEINSEKCLIFPFDITNFDELENVVQEVVGRFGKISGFIHAAGKEVVLPIKNTKTPIIEDLLKLNTLAGFEIARLLTLKKFRDEKMCSFVFISSVMGSLGEPGHLAYCISKGAVNTGVKAMALELAKSNIRVNSVSPAIIQTEMSENLFQNIPEESKIEILKRHPLGIGNPEDVALACVYLLSDTSKYITGIDLIVDGGYSAL